MNDTGSPAHPLAAKVLAYVDAIVDAVPNATTAADFAAVYANGCVAAVMCPEGAESTVGFTIGKRSDFVSYDVQEFLRRMNELEPGWGGGSTIGGAPRLEGGRRSSLSVDTVREVFLAVAND